MFYVDEHICGTLCTNSLVDIVFSHPTFNNLSSLATVASSLLLRSQ